MILIRATCDCGFHSKKARLGYHFHKWWFPIFHRLTGDLQDICRALPETQVDQIQLSKISAHKLHEPFITNAIQELIQQYEQLKDHVFNPAIDELFDCPRCNKLTLRILQVHVTAFCKDECGYEYQWKDSEERGCPRCNYRPHHFRSDEEQIFDQAPRTMSACRCSSYMDSALHQDAYCPKCGELPVSYRYNDLSICGKHHLTMQPYKMPGNFLFTQPFDIWGKYDTPNAKHWGDSNADDAITSSFCTACEEELQAFLEAEEITRTDQN